MSSNDKILEAIQNLKIDISKKLDENHDSTVALLQNLVTSPTSNKRMSLPLETTLPVEQRHSAERPTSPSKPLYNHRIILTTYPGQVGVNPIPMNWGSSDPSKRGPIIVSRHPKSIKLRNAVGAHGGSYSICLFCL